MGRPFRGDPTDNAGARNPLCSARVPRPEVVGKAREDLVFLVVVVVILVALVVVIGSGGDSISDER